MAKYGRSLRFGYAPDLSAAEPKRVLHLSALADTLGLDYLALWERPDSDALYDTWTLLTAIGMTTSRITLAANLGDLALRPPAMLAKAAATLAELTGGRLDLGLNLGTHWTPLVASQSTQLGDAEALSALDEAVQVIRLIWSGEPMVRFAGQYHRLGDVNPGPPPGRHISIWLGANAPQSLALTGRIANGWLADAYPALQPQALAQSIKHLDDAATLAGRDLGDIQRIWSINGNITDAPNSTPFQGSAAEWAETIAESAIDTGIDTFILIEDGSMGDEHGEAQLERFACEVVPRARKLLDERMDPALAPGLRRARLGAAASGATIAEDKSGLVDWVDETSMGSFPASDPPASSSFT